MKNDLNEWVKSNDDCKRFYHVTDKTITKLEISVKVEDNNIEPGIYNIKSRRYTASCNSYTVASNSAQINLISFTPTLSQSPTLILTPTPTYTLTLTPEPTLISYNNIYLSEAMVYPTSDENEWVEIYNDNDFPVSLTNWYIDDIENGGSTPKTFSLEIPPKSYKVVELTNPVFNNSSDSIRLLDFNKFQKDNFEYPNAIQGKTYGRVSFDNDVFCLQEATKGLPNNPCLNPTAAPTQKPTSFQTPFSTSSPTQEPLTGATEKILKIDSSMIRIIAPNNRKDLSIYQNTPKGEILGASYKNKKTNEPLINSLSFLSFIYSVLTIFSILLKIEKVL